jgi:hypothetical protein
MKGAAMIEQASVMSVISEKWQSMAELERKLGKPLGRVLPGLVEDGKLWRMIDATQPTWVAKYCKPHKFDDPMIGTGRHYCPRCISPSIAPKRKPETFGEAIAAAGGRVE